MYLRYLTIKWDTRQGTVLLFSLRSPPQGDAEDEEAVDVLFTDGSVAEVMGFELGKFH